MSIDATHPQAPAAPGDRPALTCYLIADALSLLGNTIAAVVLPLIVLARTGSPAAAGLVAVAGILPAIVAGLVGGAVADRVDRRRLSVAADVVSGLSIAALPVIDAVWGLGLGWFVAMGAIGAFGDLPGMTAREALAPAVAARAGMAVERLVGLREGLAAVMMLLGPALAGVLVWRLSESAVLWVVAAMSLASAAVTSRLPAGVGAYERAEAAPSTFAGAVRHALGGLRLVASDGALLALVGLAALGAAVIGTIQLLLLPVHFVATGHPELLGSALTGLAVGLLAGAGGYAAFAGRLGDMAWLRLGLTLSCVGVAAIAVLPPYPLLVGGAVLAGLGAGPANAVAAGLLIGRVHEGALGRVMGAQNTLALAALPLALLPAAFALEWASARAVGAAVAALFALGTLLALAALSAGRR